MAMANLKKRVTDEDLQHGETGRGASEGCRGTGRDDEV